MQTKAASPARVLVVDSDIDALGKLAAVLRSHGLKVSLANEVFDALEQAYQVRPDVVLAARGPSDDTDLPAALRAVPELAEVPIFRLVDDDGGGVLAPDDVLRSDTEQLLARITRAAAALQRVRAVRDLSGNIEEVPLVDLLQLLGMNRRSGTLRVTTPTGAGEIRIEEGELTDASYHRLVGEKAFIRLLSQPMGRFSFVPGDPAGQRRITVPTSAVLMDAMRQLDELANGRREMRLDQDAFVIDETALPAPESELEWGPVTTRVPDGASVLTEVLALLSQPHTLDELLDELAAPDLAIVDAVTSLLKGARIRRVPRGAARTPLAPENVLPELRLLVTRLRKPGFSSAPRIILAADPPQLARLSHAIRAISDTVLPSDALPWSRLPRLVAKLRLGDGVDLDLVGLPSEPSFAPTWALTLAASAVVVRIDNHGGAALDAHCRALDVPLVDAEGLVGTVDLAAPTQVAALLRALLEHATAS